MLPVTTAPPPTTQSPQLHPPFEADNLINNLPKPVAANVRYNDFRFFECSVNTYLSLSVASKDGKYFKETSVSKNEYKVSYNELIPSRLNRYKQM